MAGGSLGMTISIPDQVVLVGGTGRHLSDRFSFTPDVYIPSEQDGRFAVRLSSSQQKNAQSRLGPPATTARRSNGYDDEYEDEVENMYGGLRERQHVLKRLGNPLTNSAYGRWNNNGYGSYGPVTYTPGQVGRGRRGGYQNSNYRGNSTPFARYGGYNAYGYYNNNSHSYNNYSRPRYPNWNNTNSYYTSPYSFRGYNSYRGRYNNYSQRFSRRGRGRYNRNNRETISKDDLDRDLDEFRNATTKKENLNGDINL